MNILKPFPAVLRQADFLTLFCCFLRAFECLVLWMLFACFGVGIAVAQDSLTFAKVRQKGRWFLIDTAGNKILRQPQSLSASCYNSMNFVDGLAITTYDGKNGFWNLEGKQVLRNMCSRAYDFQNGYARVRFQGRWGLVNRQGKFVVEPIYDGVGNFCKEGLACVRMGDTIAFADTAGQIVIPFRYHCIVPAMHDHDELPTFSHGLAPVLARDITGNPSNQALGYINTRGEIVIPCRYRWPVDGNHIHGLYPPSFEQRWVRLIDNGTVVLVDTLGKENRNALLPDWTSGGFDHYNNVGGYSRLVNSSGETISAGKYVGIMEFSEGLAVTYLGNKENGDPEYEYIDTTGKVALGRRFGGAHNFQDGLALVWEEGKDYVFIDSSGLYLKHPGYLTEHGFHNGYASYFVLSGKDNHRKYGAIDKAGNIAVAARYDEPVYFSYGRAIVVKYGWGGYESRQHHRKGYVDTRGKVVVPLQKHFSPNRYERQPLR